MRSLIFLLLFSSQTFAALSIRDLDDDWSNGHEGVYDDVLDITWLADANLPSSNRFSISAYNDTASGGQFINSGGGMYYETSRFYLQRMNDANYLNHSAWRTPFIANTSPIFCETNNNYPTECGYVVQYFDNGVALNELAYLYYENFKASSSWLGGRFDSGGANSGIDDADDPNNYRDLFTNLYPMRSYWNGFEGGLGFRFGFGGGSQTAGFTNNELNVWLVHDGDIGLAPVPFPAAFWLFASGLISLRLFKWQSHFWELFN